MATDERVLDGGPPPLEGDEPDFTDEEMADLDAASDEWIAACEAEQAAKAEVRNARRRAARAAAKKNKAG